MKHLNWVLLAILSQYNKFDFYPKKRSIIEQTKKQQTCLIIRAFNYKFITLEQSRWVQIFNFVLRSIFNTAIDRS